MKSKIFRVNNLFKFILIFSTFLVIVDSVSAQDNSETSDQETIEKQKQITDSLKQQESELKAIHKQLKTLSDKLNYLELELKKAESFPIVDSLIYIDLPIVLVLLLLWFLNKNHQQQLFTQIDKKQNSILGKLNQLDELKGKLNNLDQIKREIIKEIKDNNQKIKNSEINLREYFNKYQESQSINSQNNLKFHANNSFIDTNQASYGYSDNAISVFNNIPQFVQIYNQDKNFVANKIIATVAETQESLNQRRSGNSDTVSLENTSQKKYWIVEEDSNYYLIPHSKIKIDDYNIKTLESLFYCVNFIAEYSNFELTKPAKVTQLSSEFWQLEEKGKLEFS